MYVGVEVYFHAFITSAIDRCEVSASCFSHFNFEKRALRSTVHPVGNWVRPRHQFRYFEKKGLLISKINTNLTSPHARKVVAVSLTDARQGFQNSDC
jgi:hypothetical protein